MSLWTSPDTLPPELELLVRRWSLPTARHAEVRQLLAAQAAGGTACALRADAPTDAASWGRACQVSPAESAGLDSVPSPLVLRRHEGKTHLQSWRFFRAEQQIARELLARAGRPAPRLARRSADVLSELGAGQLNAPQARAITCALEHTLAVVTGGPGTGKTYTMARLLALLMAAEPGRAPVIHLAAPTGKAADRMKAAVEAAADHLPAALGGPAGGKLKEAAAGASTLHRLLGFNPSTGRCRYDADEQLPGDVVIVDECSMVDTLLWQALLAALPDHTRLILLGDPNQLESVAAGDVLGSIVRAARARPATALGRVWVELTESRRFHDRAGIGALATAVVNLRASDAVRVLAENPAPSDGTEPASGLNWLGNYSGRFSWEALPAVIRSAIVEVADAETPAAALAALGRVRLLTAHRGHASGAAGLNDAIQRQLILHSGAQRAPIQPVIINHNDAETGLINGSVGIVMDVAGMRSAYFPASSADAEPRRIALSQLPDHSPAWALTIHRSQGSEFDQVVVILPDEESPLATRELIYTAITRARRCVHVWGSEESVRKALGEHALRCTLLEASLETS